MIGFEPESREITRVYEGEDREEDEQQKLMQNYLYNIYQDHSTKPRLSQDIQEDQMKYDAMQILKNSESRYQDQLDSIHSFQYNLSQRQKQLE